MILLIESIWVSLNVVDASGYLIAGLMILLLVMVMCCRLIFVDIILLATYFVFVIAT